jgi:uncharacterized protein (UPF0210 family)
MTAERDSLGAAKLVVLCNAPEDNPFMAGAFHGVGEPDAEIHVGVSGPGVVRAVLAKADKTLPLNEIAELVKQEFADWRKVMEEALVKVYGDEVSKKEAEAMVILIVGTLICNYCDVHTGRISSNIVSQFGPLLES